MITDIFSQLRRDEGDEATVYPDSGGILTIGIGHNLHTPLSERARTIILEDDVTAVRANLVTLPEYTMLDPVRQGVLENLAFWVGFWGFLKFEHLRTALRTQDWEKAAFELIHSRLPDIDEPRAKRLAAQLLTGVWQ